MDDPNKKWKARDRSIITNSGPSHIPERPDRKNNIRATNWKETAIVDAIDQKRMIMNHVDKIDALLDGDSDVRTFLMDMGPQLALETLSIALNDDNTKNRLVALKDLLDRAGFAPVQKHAVGNMNLDPETPRREILSLIEGLSKKTKVFDITDQDEDIDGVDRDSDTD